MVVHLLAVDWLFTTTAEKIFSRFFRTQSFLGKKLKTKAKKAESAED